MGSFRDIVLIVKDITQITADLTKCHVEQLAACCKKQLVKIMAWVLMVLSAILLAMVGLGMILWAIHYQLAIVTTPAVAAYILGGALLLIALIIFLLARYLLKD